MLETIFTVIKAIAFTGLFVCTWLIILVLAITPYAALAAIFYFLIKALVGLF